MIVPAAGVASLALLALSSCAESNPTATQPNGNMTATVRLAQTVSDYAGSGLFVTGPELRGGAQLRFQLYSRGSGESRGRSIGFYRFGAEMPEVGTYQLAPVDPTNPVGFVAYYHTSSANRAEAYVSVSGVASVTSATADRIEGTFSFVAAQYCQVDPATESWCVRPIEARDTQQVEITGTFSATRQTELIGEPELF